MSRVRAYFVREAEECLDAARTALDAEPADLDALHAAVRRLRGSAQMARLGELAADARRLERRLRPGPGRASVDALEIGVRASLATLSAAVAAVRSGRMKSDTKAEETMDEAVESGTGEAGTIVPLESLEYRGEAALDRALELREPLERALGSDDPAGPILDELFDLIRLGAR